MELQYLRLSNNLFFEKIPLTITNLGKLYDLNLAGNSLSGVIPRCLSNLTAMSGYGKHDDDSEDWYFETSPSMLPVLTKGQELHYSGFILPSMASINLSSNHWIGGIPEEICSLELFKNLNLSRNYTWMENFQVSSAPCDHWNHLTSQATSSQEFTKKATSSQGRSHTACQIYRIWATWTSRTTIYQKEYHQDHNLTPFTTNFQICRVEIVAFVGKNSTHDSCKRLAVQDGARWQTRGAFSIRCSRGKYVPCAHAHAHAQASSHHASRAGGERLSISLAP